MKREEMKHEATAGRRGGSAGYEVARPQGKCFVTGNTIEPGTKFMAALRETPAGFERLDISMQAWPTFDRRDVLAFWQTVMPSPQQTSKRLFVDDQVLCDLFERLAGASEPAKLNFRFVLGLILMRKRMIIYESSRVENGVEIWTVRFKGREDQLDLVNPRLNEQQVMEVSQQLGQILNEEL
ncbi:hypothetical protein [Fontivita pretiosa]|uniref:hypothetical protein n=1 Tax=Fontivita pretiosa TaxID=2989684 RepID=UPI003D17FA8D